LLFLLRPLWFPSGPPDKNPSSRRRPLVFNTLSFFFPPFESFLPKFSPSRPSLQEHWLSRPPSRLTSVFLLTKSSVSPPQTHSPSPFSLQPRAGCAWPYSSNDILSPRGSLAVLLLLPRQGFARCGSLAWCPPSYHALAPRKSEVMFRPS